MATFVLVHGALHGGWCRQKVATLLRQKGAQVITPTLTGLGERAHLSQYRDPLAMNLDLHPNDVVQAPIRERLQISSLTSPGNKPGWPFDRADHHRYPATAQAAWGRLDPFTQER